MFLILLCLFSSFSVERLTFDSGADWIPAIAVDTSCYVHITNTYSNQIRYITNKSGSSPSPKTYTYKDKDIEPGIRYYYKLGVVKTGGQTRWYGPVSAVVTGIIRIFEDS